MSRFVGGSIEAFDQAPLPVEVGYPACGRDLVGSLDPEADPNRRLADIVRCSRS